MLLQAAKEKYKVIIRALTVLALCNENGKNILPQTDLEAIFTFPLQSLHCCLYLLIPQSALPLTKNSLKEELPSIFVALGS